MTNEENKGAEFKVGERVRRLAAECQTEYTGTITRVIGSGEYGVECDDGLRRTAPHAHLRHEPAEQKAPWEPKVGETVLCDERQPAWAAVVIECTEKTIGLDRRHPQSDGRLDERRGLRGWWVYRECVRPLQGSPPARASADGCDHSWEYREPADVCRKCGIDALAYNSSRRMPKPAEPGRPDPYAEHRAKLNEELNGGCYATGSPVDFLIFERVTLENTERLSAMTLRERRKSEALRMMDRKEPAKYPHWPESWLTPGWES